MENKLNNVEERTNSRVGRDTLKENQEINNPCYKEYVLSLQCLDSNQDNKDECDLYFTNYKNCRTFWASVQRDRKLKNIKPYLPPLEERVKIKAEFLNSR